VGPRALAPEKAFPIALATGKKMSWTSSRPIPRHAASRRASKAFLMGFTDDIVVRVAEADSGSRIDVRSASRHGRATTQRKAALSGTVIRPPNFLV
jgi:Protein of unknown function (DUF1499)